MSTLFHLACFAFLSFCHRCGSSLRIKTNPHATTLTEHTFIDVFDADADQRYYLYPTKTRKGTHTLHASIQKVSDAYNTFKQSVVSMKTTDIQNSGNILILPYEICLGTVIGMNQDSASFIVQTAAHCIVDHPQFQTYSTAHTPQVSSMLVFMYSKIHYSPILYLGAAWILIIASLCACYLFLSCKFVLFGFGLLVLTANIAVHFGQTELDKTDACNLLPIYMDIKHATYNRMNTPSSLLDANDVSISKQCEILYFSLQDMLEYNHVFMDMQSWQTLLLKTGDFAFLKCEYDRKMYDVLSKYLQPSYPDIVDVELLKAMMKVSQTGILQFDNINKFVMLSGTFQRFVFNTPHGFVDLHRKRICKQYVHGCRMDMKTNGADNTDQKMLEDLTAFLAELQQEKESEYEYELYSSAGKVSVVHSEQYFIGTFGAIAGWSGSVGVVGDNLNILQQQLGNHVYHCVLVTASTEIERHKGNWCMLATHSVFAGTYYQLLSSMNEFFEIDKLNAKFLQYAKKMRKAGKWVEKWGSAHTNKRSTINMDGKVEI